ncbi:unnamed protein product [Agarophyton chilense]|eukprot:gb/GEZJ01001218.1/.p1 GENE.gb/GEZJ01001218.1/~~gb/GEZJ01001218.1/.p1  ORF type:complete len:1294 (+),score=159.92 gb/GEZJ01001218.1/:756-4637(+)
MDNAIMPLVRSSAPICAKSQSSCLLQGIETCIQDGTDVCTVKFTVILFPLLVLLIGAICMPLARYLRITYHLLILGAGVFLGLLGCGVDLGLLSVSLRQWVHVNPPAIFLYVFLAPLVFGASFNTSWHVFKRLLIPILTAALVLVILQVGLIGAFQMIVIRGEGWSWWSALMFGAMVSATDSLGVASALNSLGSSQMLTVFVDGESLVNHGSAIVLWTGFFVNGQIDALRNTASGSLDDANKATAPIGELVGDFFKLILGGIAIGLAFALVVLIFLSCVYDEFEVETSLTVIVAFLGFWTAQALTELSGVTANIASGLVLSSYGRHLITPSVRKPLGEFWNLLGWIGSTIIFVHAGMLLSVFAWSCAGEPHQARDYVYIIVWYLFLQVMRIGLFLLFRPLLSIRNKWLGWKEAFFLGCSGLRGGVSLILSLEVVGSIFPEEVKSRVVLWTTGILALCLLINGSLLKPLIRGFKFDRIDKQKAEFSLRARSVMVQRTLQILDHLCVECGYKSARWSYVIQNVLPSSWLHDAEHASDYKDAVRQIVSNASAPTKDCLERICNEERRKIKDKKLGDHLGPNDLSSFLAFQRSPTLSADIQDFHLSIRKSMSAAPSHQNSAITPSTHRTKEENQRSNSTSDDTRGIVHTATNGSIEEQIHHSATPLSMQGINRKLDCDEGHPEGTSRDREVRRRMLSSMLSHVRAITNASLLDLSVIVHLEEDIQYALDANAEDREYELFSFLNSVNNRTATIWHRGYLNIVERKKRRGESLITNTVVVMGILASILKGEMLLDSPRVRKQAEQLYEAAATLLNRIEALNPYVLGWVSSQFAIHLTERSQDSVLSDLMASGVIDEHEFNVIHAELVKIRRKHLAFRLPLPLRSPMSADSKPSSLLREHPLFAGLEAKALSSVVDHQGDFVHLQGGEELKVEKGSLVLVLQGAIRPVEETNSLSHSDDRKHSVLTGSSRLEADSPLETRSPKRPGVSLQMQGSSGNAPEKPQIDDIDVIESGCESRSAMHWCFSSFNGFCGHLVTLNSYNMSNVIFPIDQRRILQTRFRSCEQADSTIVFTLPTKHVRVLACASEEFRLEITRSLAREIVLNSIVDQSSYVLTNFFQPAPMDNTTVVGRAYQILERLPYMEVVTIRAGEGSSLYLQGPGVLLNGMVQVSVTDADGSSGSVNLLHKELTGPALLPSSGLILHEVPSKNDLVSRKQSSSDGESGSQNGDWSRTTATSSTEPDEGRQIIAHVLIEPLRQPDHIALRRLRRWTSSDVVLDMNGRFGIHCHVDPAVLLDTKVE